MPRAGDRCTGPSSSVMITMREVRDIYHQGVYEVAAAFRQLYEMIEAEAINTRGPMIHLLRGYLFPDST